ncbi:MAG: MASE1 domain-containing protein [Microcoleaceae cyanobacterium]
MSTPLSFKAFCRRFIPQLAFNSTQLLQIVAVAIAYHTVSRLAILAASLPGDITSIWPAMGVCLAATVLMGRHALWGVGLGCFVLNLESFVLEIETVGLTGKGLLVLGITTLGKVISIGLGAELVRRALPKPPNLKRVRSVLALSFLGGVVSPIPDTVMGVTVLCGVGIIPWSYFLETFWTWWAAEFIGVLVFAPPLLIWRQEIRTLASRMQKQGLETLLLLVLVIVVSEVAFTGIYPIEYMLIPVMVWAACRLGQLEISLLIVLVSVLSTIGTAQGGGSFVRDSLNASLVLLHSFVSVIALTTLMMSALVQERTQAELNLLDMNHQLENRVHHRTLELQQANLDLQKVLQDLQQTQAHLIQTEKMSSLGHLVSGIAHEINNPVSFIYGNLVPATQYINDIFDLLDLYQEKYSNPDEEIEDKVEEIDLEYIQTDLPQLLSSMQNGAKRISKIVLGLRNFSRLDESESKAVNLHDGIDNALLLLQHRLSVNQACASIQVIKNYQPLPDIYCHAGQLNQVFLNVLSNGIDALEDAIKSHALNPSQPYQPRLEISTHFYAEKHNDSSNSSAVTGSVSSSDSSQSLAPVNGVLITIADNGLGIAEDIKASVFNPFFTTKPVGQGTGLGLAISYQIVVQQHQGQLWFESVPGQGTTFLIALPLNP